MSIKMKAMRAIGKAGLTLRKYSPELLIAGGVIGFGATVVLASKATLKVEEVIDNHEAGKNAIVEASEKGITAMGEDYTEKDYKKDIMTLHGRTAGELFKLYWAPVTVGTLSIACFLTAHRVMKGRNLALAASLKALETRYNYYRSRVVEAYGEQTDYDFHNGIRRELIEVEEIDEKGKKKKVKKEVETIDPEISPYLSVFDQTTSEMWMNVPETNAIQIKYIQTEANRILQTKGHLFLNEVYDMLGMEQTRIGGYTGWIYGGDGDDHVDFSLHVLNDADTLRNSHNPDWEGGNSIILDFNVDGNILDRLN